MDCDVPVRNDGLTPLRPTGTKRCVAPAVDVFSLSAPPIFSGIQKMALLGARFGPARPIGDLTVEFYCSRQKGAADYQVMPRQALLLLPLVEPLIIDPPEGRSTCPVGAAGLIVRAGVVKTVRSEDCLGLALHLRTDRLNAAISAVLGEAHKLGISIMILEGIGSDPALGAAIERLMQLGQSDGRLSDDEAPICAAAFYGALAHVVVQRATGNTVIRVRSVNEAMRIIQHEPGRTIETTELAALVGVTAQTLRKGFRGTLNMSVKEYIQTVRLERARETLVSGRDSRTISEIANAVGFAGAAAFTRAYAKRFGETPSRARARAVREAER